MYLGVDAGNSKTVALLCRADGTVVASGRAGSGDIYGVPAMEDAVGAVLGCVQQSLRSAGAAGADVRGAAFRLAGVDWPEDSKFWERTLRHALPDVGQMSVLNDGFAPIRCVEPSGVAVAVTVGTGSAIVGRGPQGTEWSLSWWGQDQLGAVGIGQDALAAMFRRDLGLGPPVTFTPALLRTYDEADAGDLLHSFTRRIDARPWQDKGLAARAVFAAAADGDPVAIGILDHHAGMIADYARATAKRAGFDTGRGMVPVVLAGSVLTETPPEFSAGVIRKIRYAMPSAHPTLATLPPVAGAVLDALAESGITLGPDLLGTLTGSLPDAAIFRT